MYRTFYLLKSGPRLSGKTLSVNSYPIDLVEGVTSDLSSLLILQTDRQTVTIMVKEFESPETPFVSFLDTEWIQKITIKGRAPEGASRFSIFLQTGAESEPNEVAFVFDARFNYGASQNKIVTNCKIHGAWQTEEDGDCPFPFNTEENFKIKIICDEDSFKVKVNGENFLEYEQKLDDKTINCLRIENDVIIDKVKLV